MTMSLWLIVMCLCLVLAEEKISYDSSQLLQIQGITEKLKDKLIQFEDQGVLDLWNINATHVDVFVKKNKLIAVKDELQKGQFQFRVLVDNLQKNIDIENPSEPEEEEVLRGRQGHRLTFDRYQRMAHIHDYLNYLAQRYPQFIQLQDIGFSVEGRPLKVIKISSGVPNSKSIWIDGGVHGREWISPASVTYIISELVENRNEHVAYTTGIDYYILPLFNPDGYEYTHTVDRLWRKNRSRSRGCVGVDLNRNWAFHWGGAISNRYCTDNYGGISAFSEPETRAVSQFVLLHASNLKAFLSFHSYGQLILYPWGYERKVPADYADLHRVGREIAAAIFTAGGSIYHVGPTATTLYPAFGGSDDWVKGVANIKYSFSIELRDTGSYGFVLPASYIKPTGNEALAAVKALSLAVQRTI